MSSGDKSGMAIFKTKDGNYILRETTLDIELDPEVAAKEAEAEESMPDMSSMQDMDPEKMGKMMELSGKMMSKMSELDVVFRITVPGKVIEHNAMRQEGNTLHWEINASNMMSGPEFEPRIIFEPKGVNIKAPMEE